MHGATNEKSLETSRLVPRPRYRYKQPILATIALESESADGTLALMTIEILQ